MFFSLNNYGWIYKGPYPEVDALPFMKAAVPLSLVLAGAYLVFVLKIGPRMMKNREPMELKNLLLAYNAFQVVLSGYIVILGVKYHYKYGLLPTKCFASDNERRMEFFLGGWLYVFAKATELVDTIFFVLRKKTNQISFLHVYHHTLMLFFCWILFKFSPHDSFAFLGTFNGLVHIFMYAYYGLSAVPGMAKYLWWKKYLTTMQLIQFVAVFIHFQIASYVSECPPPRVMIWFANMNNFTMMYLFGKFYIDNYTKNGGLDVKRPASSKQRLVKQN